MAPRIRPIIAAVALLTLTGCSGGSSTPAASSATSSSSAAPADPYDAYSAHDTAAGLTPEVQRDEATSVAGNTCDNTVQDMTGLVTSAHDLYATTDAYQGFLIDRANFIDAYCPSARVVYNAATQQAVGKVIPAAH